ncbi:MAG: exodeoxyribonuclease III [Bacteroidetes bacterium]|nr:exodeoxyribonuclease III [Bacteroidota bacterium]
MAELISYNVNGIRAAIKKGFYDWLKKSKTDIICVQETKAMQEQVETEELEKLGYTQYWFSAEKKGYSGVAVFSKLKPDNIELGMGIDKYDSEGRVIKMDFGNVSLINAYFPSGSSGDHRQEVKMAFLDDFYTYTEELQNKGRELIICGDYNICRKPIDIHNPVGNVNSSGFLPEEREWFAKFMELGFIDTFRHFHDAPHNYTWWSYRFNVRARNLGWRIDYFLTSRSLEKNLMEASILPEVKHSDHCPVRLKINL